MTTPGPDAFDEWVERNPLRAWRKQNRKAIMRVASQLGVSMTIIQLWERGVHIPSDENMARIAKLMGPGAVGAWAKWWNERPNMNGQ